MTLRDVVDRVPLPGETITGVLAALLAQRVLPLALPARVRPVGAACATGGLALVLAAWRERGPVALEHPSALVTTGVHGASRNPMYVGFDVLHLGASGPRTEAALEGDPASPGAQAV